MADNKDIEMEDIKSNASSDIESLLHIINDTDQDSAGPKQPETKEIDVEQLKCTLDRYKLSAIKGTYL